MTGSKQDYINALQLKVDKINQRKSKPAKAKRTVAVLIVAIGTVASVLLGIRSTVSEQDIAYAKYTSEEDADLDSTIPYGLLGYKDTFELWNSRDIGNDVNNLLSGGKVLIRNEVRIVPGEADNCSSATLSNGEVITINGGADYLNFYDGTVFYRNVADRKLYTMDIRTGDCKVLLDGNVGEVFVSEGTIYYIDFQSNNSVFMVSADFGDSQEVIDEPIASFAVCGQKLVYLTTNKSMRVFDLTNGTTDSLVDNIERFFIGKRIYAENGNTIFSFTPEGQKGKLVYKSEDDSIRLVGVLDGIIFYQENSLLKCLVEGQSNTVVDDNHAAYTSPVCVAPGENEYMTVVIDSINGIVKQKTVSFQIPEFTKEEG